MPEASSTCPDLIVIEKEVLAKGRSFPVLLAGLVQQPIISKIKAALIRIFNAKY